MIGRFMPMSGTEKWPAYHYDGHTSTEPPPLLPTRSTALHRPRVEDLYEPSEVTLTLEYEAEDDTPAYQGWLWTYEPFSARA